MANLSELLYVMGKHLGIYAKDSLDDLLLITHPSSSYKGMTRRVERSAVKEYIDGLSKYEDEKEWAEDFPYEVGDSRDDIEWNERSEPNGDNFPYIRGHMNSY
jgi:hypothetical protein